MKPAVIRCTAIAAFVLVSAGADLRSADRPDSIGPAISSESPGAAAYPVQAKGRYKKEGDNRVWGANDRGPDQCTPARGRWKKGGTGRVWDSKDSAPNQCNPRQPRK